MKQIIFIISTLAVGILATPQGAPADACRGLVPFHNETEAQRSTPPYQISIVEETINRSWLVTIRATPGFTFKGVIIQARDAGSPETYETFGVFSKVVQTDTDLQTTTCLEPNDTATHTNNNEKTQVQIRWSSPTLGAGTVVFRYTVLQQFDTFWGVLQSEPLRFQ